MPIQYPATHSPRLKNQVPPKVVALGDSLTYGYGDWEQGGWVDRLKRYWMRPNEDGLPNPILYNLGVRGDTIRQTHQRLEFEFRQRGELRNQLPQLLLLSFGVNDSARLGKPDGRHMVPFAEFQSHLVPMLDDAKALSSVLFLGMVPVNESKMPFMDAFFFTQEDQYLYKEVTRLACQERGIPYLDIFEIWRQRGQGWINARLMADGLHPNPLGYESLFEDIQAWPELEIVYNFAANRIRV
jgi:lysophospholipase L1-like esterase